MHNPSLREEPLHGRAPTVPMSDTLSLLDWLRAQGRLVETVQVSEEEERLAEEDISVLMGEEEKYDDEDEQ